MDSYAGWAIDISNYTGELTVEQVADCKAQGVALVIVRLSLETDAHQLAVAVQQIRTLQAAQMPWQGYVWCYWRQDPGTLFQDLKSSYGDLWDGYYGRTLWLDDEEKAGLGITNYAWLRSAAWCAELQGFVAGIYTRRSLWDGGSRKLPPGHGLHFAEWRLWLADWDYDGASDVEPLPPFTSVAIVQSPNLPFGVPSISVYDRNQAFHVS